MSNHGKKINKESTYIVLYYGPNIVVAFLVAQIIEHKKVENTAFLDFFHD